MKLPATRRNALCMTLCWFAFSMGYFGLVYNTPAFDWNIYLVFVFPTFFMIPVSLSQPFMENRLGRKPVMTSTMVLAGLCLLLTSGVPKGIIVIILGNYILKRSISKGQSYTSKSLSEALLFSELWENMLFTKIVLNVRNNFCTQHILPRFELGIFM